MNQSLEKVPGSSKGILITGWKNPNGLKHLMGKWENTLVRLPGGGMDLWQNARKLIFIREFSEETWFGSIRWKLTYLFMEYSIRHFNGMEHFFLVKKNRRGVDSWNWSRIIFKHQILAEIRWMDINEPSNHCPKRPFHQSFWGIKSLKGPSIIARIF